jgi:uncharacterized protein (DUF1330 family)
MAAYVFVGGGGPAPAADERYKTLAPPAIAAYGGRYLARGGRCVTLEGDWAPARAVILEFPSLERAQEWWASAEYEPGKALRHASARSKMIVIEGVSP